MARLTTKQMMDATLTALHHPNALIEMLQQVAELHEKVKVFEATVWFPRLQAIVNSTEARGMSGECRGIKVMTWCCAGRCLIQLEKAAEAGLCPYSFAPPPHDSCDGSPAPRGGKATITLITSDDEQPWWREMASVAPGMGPMGIQSIDAEWLDAMVMLYTVTRWGHEITLIPNPDVTLDNRQQG